MDITFIYTQKRKEFGKPYSFTDIGPHLLVDIDPDPELKDEFYVVSSMSREVDNSKRICAQEINTVSYPTVIKGMKHTEGGWPAGVDFEDEDSVARFRKKTEKDKAYVNFIKTFADTMEMYIMQNNSINIYEEYFSGERIKSSNKISFRSVNVFHDPNDPVRKVVDLSWSEHSLKIAAAYSREGLKTPFNEGSLYSYVWDVKNFLQPYCVLEPELCLNCIEFNPVYTDLLLGGYVNGQVALWDIRVDRRPQQLSSIESNSHTQKVTGIKWFKSSSNMDFITTSVDGKVMSWDARNLKQPTEILILGPERNELTEMNKCYTVNCVEYDSRVPEVFMLGTEQGDILSFYRQAQSPSDKLSALYDCKNHPVLKIKRNAFFPQLFASCNPWNITVWSEKATESPVLNIISKEGYFTDIDWSPSRASLLFITKTNGSIEMWDIPGKTTEPLKSIIVGKEELYSLAVQNSGKLLACSTLSGSIHVLEIPDFLQQTSEVELEAIQLMIGGPELVEAEPRPQRLQLSYLYDDEEEVDFEDRWDPPETAEELYEEFEILFKKYPLFNE
ncbi:dynein intermediate chain 3, ciliary [Trichonephila inaurata madagascariensis]|uniref:Dynein intermediate chain 3, ciliary n=1 Tax=Trichonephila inaurata madagascariensis TaxID=2747483 RepID=A0A8X7C5G4_9ARAC|nr:dynein intermediate chain 3, ciliary [Trichonephila inaurata madagascariensis]